MNPSGSFLRNRVSVKALYLDWVSFSLALIPGSHLRFSNTPLAIMFPFREADTVLAGPTWA
jgi:hypothetical protein